MVTVTVTIPNRKGPSMKTDEMLATLDEAVGAFAKEGGDQGSIVTGWVLSVSVMHPSMPGSDGYFSAHSPGLPHHTQMGLFHSALEEMKTTVMMNHLERGKG